jgi:hypothetical protein
VLRSPAAQEAGSGKQRGKAQGGAGTVGVQVFAGKEEEEEEEGEEEESSGQESDGAAAAQLLPQVELLEGDPGDSLQDKGARVAAVPLRGRA